MKTYKIALLPGDGIGHGSSLGRARKGGSIERIFS